MKLGQNKLEVKKIIRDKIILSDGQEEIELKESKKDLEVALGDRLEVFVYDVHDKRKATIEKPKVLVGEVGELKIVSKTKFGYFVDIGLEKDIFLPYQERIGRVEEGESYLMALYIDKSDRLCVTMKIKDKLKLNKDFKVNDIVEGVIYDIDKLGAHIAIKNKYDGLILKNELKGIYKIGEHIEARIQRILKDNRITLTLRQKAYKQMYFDAEMLLDIIKDEEGILPLGDKSDSEVIKDMTGLSKSAFKKALGALYKKKLVKLYPEKTVLIKNEDKNN